jgi:hypothetical protein
MMQKSIPHGLNKEKPSPESWSATVHTSSGRLHDKRLLHGAIGSQRCRAIACHKASCSGCPRRVLIPDTPSLTDPHPGPGGHTVENRLSSKSTPAHRERVGLETMQGSQTIPQLSDPGTLAHNYGKQRHPSTGYESLTAEASRRGGGQQAASS